MFPLHLYKYVYDKLGAEMPYLYDVMMLSCFLSYVHFLQLCCPTADSNPFFDQISCC